MHSERFLRTSRQLFIVAFVASSVGLHDDASAQNAPQVLDTMRVEVSSRTGAVAAGMRSVTIVSREMIDRTAARTLADVLAPITGVDIRPRSPASADVALRGASAEGVIVLVDGVRVSDQQSGHFDLDLGVPLSMVDHIEILRGTSSALYGADAVGGVINIVTRTHRPTSASVSAGGGSFGTSSFAADASQNAVSGAVDFMKSDGQRPGTDYSATQARASMSGNMLSGIVRVDGGLGVRHFGAADFYGAYPAYEDTRSATAAVSYDANVGSTWLLTARADTRRHGDLFTLYRDNPALYQNQHTSWQSGAEVVAHGQPVEAVALAIGADAHDLTLTSARLGNHETQRSALYSEVTVGQTGHASMDVGTRIDWSSEGSPFFSPSLAAMLPIGNMVTLRASGARGFRQPTWTELYYQDPANIGDSTLTAETFWSGEVGANAALSRRMSVDAVYFWRKADQLIDWTKPSNAPDALPWHTMNVESATYHGVESEATLRELFDADWTVRASALSFSSNAASGFKGKYALSPITSSLGLSGTFHIGDARLGFDGARSRRAGESNQTLANVRFSVPFAATNLKVDLYNLGNASYKDVSGAPIAGRAVQASLSWRL
jgi:iron complex outermembrane receptor protein